LPRLRLRALLRHTLAGIARPDQVLVVGPHDALVLNYATELSPDEADRVRGRIRADFPGLIVLLVSAARADVNTDSRERRPAVMDGR
jgi:hypothetical protein